MAVGTIVAAAVTALATLTAAIVSGVGASRDRKAAEKALNDYKRALDAIPMPEFERIRFEELGLQTVGQYIPELLGDTELRDITTDPAFRAAQLSAFEELKERGETGFTPSEQARIVLATQQADLAEKQARDAASMQFQQRGTLGSGADLLNQQFINQQLANRRSTQAREMAITAEDRALQSLMGAAQLGQQMESTDYARQAELAKARDEIARFNTQYLNDAKLQNIQDKYRQAALRMQVLQANNAASQAAFNAALAKSGAQAPFVNYYSGQAAQGRAAAAGYLQTGMEQTGRFVDVFSDYLKNKNSSGDTTTS